MLKDRQTHKIGRSLVSGSYSSQAAGVRYNSSTNFNEDDHRDLGFRYYFKFKQFKIINFLIYNKKKFFTDKDH